MRLINRYQLKEEIGRGGMGTVYQAWDEDLQRGVALKLLPAHLSHNETFLRRFRREVMLAARLEHAHIVPIYDVGEYEGRPFLVMRWLRGGSLRNRLAAGNLSRRDLWQLLEQIAQALDTAHAQHIVHRDIKPANILFDEGNNAYLTDFGIAKAVGETTDATELTGANLIGSPAYMSPEQFTGKGIDGRSDQYSLAVVVYEALAGAHPFSGDTVQMMYHHLYETPPPLQSKNPKLPASLQPPVAKALAKTPGDRFENVTDFVNSLTSGAGLDPDSATFLPRKQPPAEPVAQGTATRVKQIEAAYQEGLQAMERGEWEKAVLAFAQVLRMEPGHPKAQQRQQEAQQRLQEKHLQEKEEASKSKGVARAAAALWRHPWPAGIALLLVALILAIGAANARNWGTSNHEQNDASPAAAAGKLPGPTQTATPEANLLPVVGSTPTPGVTTTSPRLLIDLAGAGSAFADGTQIFPGSAAKGAYLLPEGEAGHRLLLSAGQLLVAASGVLVSVANPFGARAEVTEGIMGVAVLPVTGGFEAHCLEGTCTLWGDVSGQVSLAAGESGLVGGSGRPEKRLAADYARFAPLAPNLAPTPTATPTPTKTPTATPTPAPTATPRPQATATIPADRDGDGVLDYQDNCPDTPGVTVNRGCLYQPPPTISTPYPPTPPPPPPSPPRGGWSPGGEKVSDPYER